MDSAEIYNVYRAVAVTHREITEAMVRDVITQYDSYNTKLTNSDIDSIREEVAGDLDRARDVTYIELETLIAEFKDNLEDQLTEQLAETTEAFDKMVDYLERTAN